MAPSEMVLAPRMATADHRIFGEFSVSIFGWVVVTSFMAWSFNGWAVGYDDDFLDLPALRM
jgi:hypothetical protein